MIKPEIGKLPKTIVDRIPLVIRGLSPGEIKETPWHIGQLGGLLLGD
jgi:hypothetical protein